MRDSAQRALLAGREGIRATSYTVLLMAFGAFLPVFQPWLFTAPCSERAALAIAEVASAILIAGYTLLYSQPRMRSYFSLLFRGIGLLAVGASLTGVVILTSGLASALGVVGASSLILSALLTPDGSRLLEYAATNSLDDILFYAILVAAGALVYMTGFRVASSLIEAASTLPVYELVTRYMRRNGLNEYDKMVASSLIYASISLAALAILS